MSTFWSAWVMFLVTLNIVITLFLFVWAQKVIIPTQEDGTTGHAWAHGVLRESVRRLPAWWVVTSAGMFVFAFFYLLLFPGFGAWKGLLGWTQHEQHATEVELNQILIDEHRERFAMLTSDELAGDPLAQQIGERLYIDNCSACHQRNASGNRLLGAPSLVDDDWTWGGDDASIRTSILEGRQGVMPPLGTLGADTVTNIAHYVLSLSASPHDATRAAAGQPQFMVCAACHGMDGTGNAAMGAPNLTDSIWTWSDGDLAGIERTITGGLHGVMPAWKERLDEDDARVIIAWLRSQPESRVAASR